MKRLFLLVMLGVTVFAFSVYAETEERLEVNQTTGEVRTVFIDTDWREFTEQEMLAYKDPGAEKVVDSQVKTTWERVDFFYYVPIKKCGEVVVFTDGKLNTIKGPVRQCGEAKFTWHILVLFLAILLMIISNIFMWRQHVETRRQKEETVLAAVFAALAALAASAASSVLAASAVASAAFSPFAAGDTDKKVGGTLYWIFIVIFYVCAVVAMFV